MNQAEYTLATLKRMLSDMHAEEEGRYKLLYVSEILAMIAEIEADAVLGDGVEA